MFLREGSPLTCDTLAPAALWFSSCLFSSTSFLGSWGLSMAGGDAFSCFLAFSPVWDCFYCILGPFVHKKVEATYTSPVLHSSSGLFTHGFQLLHWSPPLVCLEVPGCLASLNFPSVLCHCEVHEFPIFFPWIFESPNFPAVCCGLKSNRTIAASGGFSSSVMSLIMCPSV